MARLVTLHDSDGEVIYPQSVWDENMIPDNTVTDDMIDWSTMPGSYSTIEQRTPFTWIDGKPIYKKTINIGTLPNNTRKSVSHSIANLERIIKSEGWALASNGVELPLPYADIAAAGSVCIYASSTEIIVAASANRSEFSGYVTLYYTKTTD